MFSCPVINAWQQSKKWKYLTRFFTLFTYLFITDTLRESYPPSCRVMFFNVHVYEGASVKLISFTLRLFVSDWQIYAITWHSILLDWTFPNHITFFTYSAATSTGPTVQMRQQNGEVVLFEKKHVSRPNGKQSNRGNYQQYTGEIMHLVASVYLSSTTIIIRIPISNVR